MDVFERPPADKLTLLLTITDVKGNPPIAPAIEFPTPWAISSWFLETFLL